MSKRVNIQLEGGQPKLVNISEGMSLEEFLETCTKKLGISAKRIFNQGSEIDEMDVVRDGDVLVITDGGTVGQKKKSSAKPEMKIAVIGAGGVGKSAITVQYVQGRFLVDYDPTIEDAHRKQVMIDGQTYILDILDTAGQEDYTVLRAQWLREKEGFLLVYSVIDRRTFEEVQQFFDQMKQIHDVCPPLVVVGNKADMTDKRTVTKFEGSKLAESLDKSVFMETSAKTGTNIDECFVTLVREIEKRRGPPVSARRKICAIL